MSILYIHEELRTSSLPHMRYFWQSLLNLTASIRWSKVRLLHSEILSFNLRWLNRRVGVALSDIVGSTQPLNLHSSAHDHLQFIYILVVTIMSIASHSLTYHTCFTHLCMVCNYSFPQCYHCWLSQHYTSGTSQLTASSHSIVDQVTSNVTLLVTIALQVITPLHTR